jgi:hypothetical protein
LGLPGWIFMAASACAFVGFMRRKIGREMALGAPIVGDTAATALSPNTGAG